MDCSGSLSVSSLSNVVKLLVQIESFRMEDPPTDYDDTKLEKGLYKQAQGLHRATSHDLLIRVR